METSIAEIDSDYITLGQLLKALGFVQTGGQAKIYLQEYVVYLDGQPENRRGKKIYPGSRVVFPHEDQTFIIQGPSASDRDLDRDLDDSHET